MKPIFILFFAVIVWSTPANAQWVIPNLIYDSNSAVLTSQAKSTLDTLIIFLKDNRRIDLVIYSFTDSAEALINEDLSQSRSEMVEAYFVAAGIELKRIVAKAGGASNPIMAGQSVWRNRRTEFRAWEDSTK